MRFHQLIITLTAAFAAVILSALGLSIGRFFGKKGAGLKRCGKSSEESSCDVCTDAYKYGCKSRKP